MKRRTLIVLFILAALWAAGCANSDPGANAPPAKPVTQSDIEKMTPQQKAGYEQALKSMNGARSLHNQSGGASSGGS